MIARIKALLNMYKTTFHKRDKNIWIFGEWLGCKFNDNSKYLFLKAIKQGINATWITKSDNIYNQLKKKNLPVEMHNSEKGIELQKNAGYAIYNVGPYDFDEQYLGGCTLINLDHCIPIKKMFYDDTITRKQPRFLRIFKDKVLRGICFHKTYKLSSSSTYTPINMRAYGLNRKHIIESGSPRNDVFFTDEYGEESDYSFINNRKVIAYLPTHRREGNIRMDVENNLELDKINQICLENNYLFIINKHFYHKFERTNLEKYSNIIDTTPKYLETQELLKHIDVLITDYSSVYVDYLLLDKPIIFYNYDYEDYTTNDRELYFNYEDVTPGPRITNKEDLTKIIRDICSGKKDEYSSERKRCLDIFFDGKKEACSEEIIEIIKNI